MAKQRRRTQHKPQKQPSQSPPPAPAQPPAATATTPTVDKAQVQSRIQDLEKARNSRVISYFTSDVARISDAATIPLYDQLNAIGKTEQIDLFLYTRGGDSEVPWRMVSLIRDFCKRFNVLVPHRASSAGTVLAMGADEIVMTPLSVLGPIDPSRTHPLLPRPEGSAEAEPISVQDMRHAMQFIREAAGTGEGEMPYSPDAWAQIFTALFDKVHPLAIGAIEQSYALAKLIGRRCLETHMDPDQDGPKIEAIVNRLCDDYKSHQYQISRAEAREVGLNAVDAPDDVADAMMELFKLYPPSPQPAGGQQPQQGKPFKMHIAWFDSTALNLHVEGEYILDSTSGELKPQGDLWSPY